MNPFSKIKKNLFSIFQTALIGLLVVLMAIFVVVLFSENPEWIFNLLGIDQNGESKYEALKFLGIGMGGALVALQALMAYKRAKALENTAEAQADAAKAQADAVSKTEQGQRQDRLKNAIEHLGDESDSVRLGGAYELFHLAEDTENLRQTALDILCAHIRQATGESEYREKHKSKPSEEVQSLLTLLFVQEYEIFKGCRINLQGSWLNGADLREARLWKAQLTKAHLREASLSKAELQGAILQQAQLQGAIFSMAKLQGTNLDKASLQGTFFIMAQLHGASLFEAQLQGANLEWTQLQGAILYSAQLQGAILRKTQMQGIGGENLPFEDKIKSQINQETDLFGVIFEGGLSREKVESLVKDLSDGKASELRERLRSHIDMPASKELPEDSGAITGSYTEEDAEQWIAEYEQAMSEVPEDDS